MLSYNQRNQLTASASAGTTFHYTPRGTLSRATTGSVSVDSDVVGQFTNTGTALAGTAVYDPLGKVLSTSGMVGNLGYQSEWTELSSGRVNMHARWYNPDTGQFDTRDSQTNPATPQSGDANRYTYGSQNPLTQTDPTGHHDGPLEGPIDSALGGHSMAMMYEKPVTGNPAIDCGHAIPCFLAGLFSPLDINEMIIAMGNVTAALTRLLLDPKYREEFGETLDAGVEALKKEAAAWQAKLVNLGIRGIAGVIGGWACVLTGVCERINDCFGSGDGYCTYHIGATLGDIVVNFFTGGGVKLTNRIVELIRKFDFGKRDKGDGTNNKPDDNNPDPNPTKPYNPNNLPPEERPDKPGPDNKPDEPPGPGKGNGGNDDGDGEAGPTVCPVPWRSFDPATPVLMADGSAKPIEDITIGEKVIATDPVTGQTTAQEVTALHVNLDRDLTNVTIGEGEGDRSTRGPTGTTLETTNHHPFWDSTSNTWVNAADLTPGQSTVTDPQGNTSKVTAVDSFAGARLMRDLTVANIHTYYVVAGNRPVLVHNNDTCNRAQARAIELQGSLYRPDKERGGYAFENDTTSVIFARDKDGALRTVVTSNRYYVPKAIKNMLNPDKGELHVNGKGHAEATGLDYIAKMNWTFLGGGTNRNVCAWCEDNMRDQNIGLTGPTHKGRVRTLAGVFTFLGERMFGPTR